ncbi:General transcription factor IIH subunit 4 [Frankliniella fusca]|uniref:General transcription factor IIH subunit 4 n=1 Tax=Frankliniella fusca TaxID=407009 RepID=A0AAE1LDS7_9NEOP|nr:General transcription factor IIH subunit 4 [Frankliniella fusca]
MPSSHVPNSFSLSLTPVADLRSVKPACNATVEISGAQDVGSPALTPALAGRPLTCWYRFRNFRSAPKDWVLRIRFRRFKVGTLVNGTTCLGGHLQAGAEQNRLLSSKLPSLLPGLAP